MEQVRQDETPTKPSPRPYALPLENGLRRVKTNGVEHDALVGLGYVPVESDDAWTLLRPERRAGDRRVTVGDLRRYRDHERDVLEQVAAELQAHGATVDASQIRWAMDEFRVRVMKETGSAKTVVSGRLR